MRTDKITAALMARKEWRKIAANVPSAELRNNPCSAKVICDQHWHNFEGNLGQTREKKKSDTVRRNLRLLTVASLRREQSPTRTLKLPGRSRVQITCNTSGASRVQFAACHVVGGTAQL